jgi:hypothetical protein
MNTKSLLAITAIPLLGLSIFMSTKTPTVQTDTNVERQEFSIVEQKAIQTEVKVAEIDTKVQEVVNTQAEQAKQIEEVKVQVQKVKTVIVQAPAPVVTPEPVKVVEIDYCKELQKFLATNNLPISSSSRKENWCIFSFTAKAVNYSIQYSKEANLFAGIVNNKVTDEHRNLNFEQAKAFILSVK